ncbi:MAG TPA: GGDEF domain-containing protein [Actinophytocola sp.]|nr:GGDEF domain-containing protein [Actinophytocola sp.]HET9142906.1 GGDEF domain-containing protein [Actinophytocola sp.]
MPYPVADTGAPVHTQDLIALHESIAELLARRGQWRQAYEHARQALDLVATQRAGPSLPLIPEQFREEVDQLRREHAEAREQAIRDALTASYNRRYLDQRLVALVEQSPGGAAGLAVALVDLDRFKLVNDTFGHHVGDRVLQRVVTLLQDDLPEAGFCARYGGEEFVLVLPDLAATPAVELAESARMRVERFAWDSIAAGLRVTVSIGLAHEPLDTASPEEQLHRADTLLYDAKRAGRNAVAYLLDGQTRLAGAAGHRRSVSSSATLTPRRPM